MCLDGAEKSVKTAKKPPECLKLFCLTKERMEPPRTCRFEVMGETKYSQERHIKDAEFSLNEE